MIRKRKFKTSKVVQRRRKKFFIYAAAILLLTAAIILGLSYLSKLKNINIGAIDVSGNSITPEEEILDIVNDNLAGSYWGLFSKRNSLIFPEDKIKNSLLQDIERLSNVSIIIDDFKKMSVEVKEREAEAMWCRKVVSDGDEDKKKENCYFLDSEGYIYSKAPTFSGNVFLKVYGNINGEPIGKSYLEEVEFQSLMSFLNILEKDGLEAESLEIDKNNDFALNLVKGGKIIFNRKQDLNILAQDIHSIFSDQEFKEGLEDESMAIDYIDLRFGRKVFYKLK